MTGDRIRTVCLLTLTTIAVGAALYWLRPVMVPFVLALFFALSLSPLIDLMVRKLRWPRGVAIAGTLLLGVAILLALGLLISNSVAQMRENTPQYDAQLRQLVDRGAQLVERLGGDPDRLLGPLKAKVSDILLGTVNAVWSVLSLGVLVLIFMCFMLTGTRVAPPGGMWSEVKHKVRTYLATKMAVSVVTGVLVGGVLSLLGIDLALVFGLFAFLLNFIPNIGSIVSVMLPLPVVLLSPEVSSTTALFAILIPGIIQFSVGNIVEPKIMGSAVDLHPVTVLVALIFWGMLWGFVGMLLSVPLTAVLKIVFERMELTAPVANVLAGRPPKPDA